MSLTVPNLKIKNCHDILINVLYNSINNFKIKMRFFRFVQVNNLYMRANCIRRNFGNIPVEIVEI
jgi:hypothetical protein